MEVYKTNQQHLEMVSSIKKNDTNTLRKLYTLNYPKIEAYILQNNGDKDYAKDIYQEAFLAVWQNIKQNKFIPKSENSINGYLYTIARNKWTDVLRSKGFKNTTPISQLTYFETEGDENNGLDDDILKDQRLQSVMHAFTSLGNGCKDLLKKFYFEKKSMNLIADELKLDSASTRNKKYRCMQKLREIALNND